MTNPAGRRGAEPVDAHDGVARPATTYSRRAVIRALAAVAVASAFTRPGRAAEPVSVRSVVAGDVPGYGGGGYGTDRFGVPGSGDVPPVPRRPSTDPDGDGRYEDVNGDGRVDVPDVQALFRLLDDGAHAGAADAYDFNGDWQFDVLDVTALYERVR